MIPNQIAAFKILEQAQLALKSGDKNTARQLAAQSAKLAPEIEEVWLLMAALASPHGSVTYLEKALSINPNSERASKGLIWAQARMSREQAARAEKTPQTETLQPQKSVVEEKQPEELPIAVEEPAPPAPQEPEQQPPIKSTPSPFDLPELISSEPPIPAFIEQAEPALVDQQPQEPERIEQNAQSETGTPPVAKHVKMSYVQNGDSVARPRFPFVSILVIVIFIAIALAAWQGASAVGTFVQSVVFTSQDRGPAWAEVKILKSSGSQPVFDVTTVPVTGTAEPLSEPTTIEATPTPEVSETPLPTTTNLAPIETFPAPTEPALLPTFTLIPPTQLPLPTEIPLPAPTETPYPTEIVLVLPTPDLGPLLPSPTPLPTDTDLPNPTKVILPTTNPGGVAGGGGTRWLDVDLTNQRVYAYEGDTIVNSFLASTGTWQTPTVTGQYHVYVKYKYTDMTGPGYYLPNVPNTMYFYEGYAVHGTYWHNNFGTPMSHGCVNLSIPDSAWVFNFASVGTLVNVHY